MAAATTAAAATGSSAPHSNSSSSSSSHGHHHRHVTRHRQVASRSPLLRQRTAVTARAVDSAVLNLYSNAPRHNHCGYGVLRESAVLVSDLPSPRRTTRLSSVLDSEAAVTESSRSQWFDGLAQPGTNLTQVRFVQDTVEYHTYQLLLLTRSYPRHLCRTCRHAVFYRFYTVPRLRFERKATFRANSGIASTRVPPPEY
jgi:hypothetical protein